MSGPEDFAAQVRALVERTCAEQGVPVQVTDRDTVERVMVLLGRRDAGGGPKRGSAGPAPAPADLEAPDRSNASDVDCASASGARHDLHEVDHGLDDVALSVEVEFGPLLAEGGPVADVGVDVPRAG